MAEHKKIQSVEILHLDETGYGPEGLHTRREWREECLTNLLAGKEQFEAWQRSWEAQAQSNDNEVSFGLNVSYDDGSQQTSGQQILRIMPSHTLDFSGQVFEQDLNCEGFAFLYSAGFSMSQFSGDADFNSSHFSGDAIFGAVQFLGDATFGAVQFSGDAIFGAVQFSGDAIFHMAQFLAKAFFPNCKFLGEAYFRRSHFSDFTDFAESHFSYYAKFSWAEFSEPAYFRSSHFSSDVDFYESQFSRDATFGASQFAGGASFGASQFSGHANFSQALFKAGSIFDETTFAARAYFENAIFANVGHFVQTHFQTRIPAFRGCKIDATRLEFSDEEHFSSEDYTEDAIKNISFLKRLADQHGQVDQAIEFNAMELRAKRNNRLESIADKSWMQRLTNGDCWTTRATGVYQYASDFGRSFTIPMKWYGCLLLATCLLALLSSLFCAPQVCQNNASHNPLVTWSKYNECDQRAKIYLTAYTAATEYTLYRASGFFHFSDKGKQTIEVNRRLFNSPVEPWFMRLWGLCTSFASTVLFFFIGLGLRNRYRIK